MKRLTPQQKQAQAAERERRMEWHGWVFQRWTPEQAAAIKHYLHTGERLPNLPYQKEQPHQHEH